MSRINSIPIPRISNDYERTQLLAQLQNNQLQLAKLETQVSTGQKYALPSDDPNAALRGIAMQTALSRNGQLQTNINMTNAFLGATDSALSSVSDALNQALTQALQATGSTASDSQRAIAAQSVSQLLNQVLASANQTFNGRSLFAGTATGTTAFTRTTAGVVYNGNDQSLQTFQSLNALMPTNIDGNTAFGAMTSALSSGAFTPSLSLTTQLSQLNSGQGVSPGSIIVSDGTHSSTIDLSSASTLGDVAQLIERNPPAGRTVTAHVTPTGLTIQLDSAGGGNLSITDVGSGHTAEQLGIANTAAIGTGPLVGLPLQPALLATTPLADLLGTRASANMSSQGPNNDLLITAPQNGTDYNGVTVRYVDSSHLQAGPGLTAGHERAFYSAAPLSATAALMLPGAANDLVLTATTAGTAYNNAHINIVNGGAIGDNATASWNAGTNTLTLSVDSTGQTSTQTLINAINAEGHFNAARDSSGEANSSGGVIPASAIGLSGSTYNTGADANTLTVIIQSGSSTANQIAAAINSQTSFTAQLDPAELNNDGTGAVQDSYGQPLNVAVTANGSGTILDQVSGLQVTNGGQSSVIDLSGAKTVQDLLNSINGSGAYLYARINSAGTGIEVQSRLSGSALSIGENGGTTATQLGIRTFTDTTPLSALNNGNGITVTPGTSFSITRMDGVSFNVDVNSATTIGDVLGAINNNATNLGSGIPVVASLNKYGNGIQLSEDGPPNPGSGSIQVTPGTAGALVTQLGLVPVGATISATPNAGATASATVASAGANNDLLFNATGVGSAVNGATISFVDTGANPPSVNYNPATKQLVFGVQSGVTTANTIISTLAADPTASQYFTASLDPADGSPNDGTGAVDVTATATANGGAPQTLSGDDVNPQQTAGVFTALLNLQSALESNDTAAIGSATDMLKSSIVSVNAARAEIGVWQQGMDALQTQLNSTNTNLQTGISNTMDIDMAAVISQLMSQQTAYEATLRTAGSISQLTLLNFI
ncbi:MAG: flagellar hook-associated protein FlgL [Planctomycetes bacterium]|nr:flagellar hook-associated protein FlgL [Planctomycetota bacterium]